MVSATRWAYERYIGPIPDGLLVCHTCDNPPCQNPAHWFLGTPLDNMTDKVNKGRHRTPKGRDHYLVKNPERAIRGERHYAAKLSDEEVSELRARYAAGGVFQRDLATEYGITQQQVSRIVRGVRRV